MWLPLCEMSRGERPTEAGSRWVVARSGGEWQEGETASSVQGFLWGEGNILELCGGGGL